jgi:hypothetical protein
MDTALLLPFGFVAFRRVCWNTFRFMSFCCRKLEPEKL